MKKPVRKSNKAAKSSARKRAVAPDDDAGETEKKFDTLYAYNQEINTKALEELKARGGRRATFAEQWNAKKKVEFLSCLRDEGMTIRDAADRVGVSCTTLYKTRGEDVEFAAAWDVAYDQGTTVLEAEAQRRAVQGVTEPVFNKGVIVGHVQKYSDLLLIFLLKARAPQRFRDNVDMTNSDGSIAAAFAAAVRKAAS